MLSSEAFGELKNFYENVTNFCLPNEIIASSERTSSPTRCFNGSKGQQYFSYNDICKPLCDINDGFMKLMVYFLLILSCATVNSM